MAKSAQLSGKQGGENHIVLLLSLNLILLAFFILLNAMSNFESQKTEAVLDSVNRAFRGPIQTPRDADSAAASLGVLPLPQDLTNEIGSLFESFVPSARVKKTARATVMTVELPASELFRPGTSDIRPERKILIRRLARALMRDPGRIMKYELAFEHGTDGATSPGAGNPDAGGGDTARSVQRGETVARYLIRQSIPHTALSIGLRPGVPGTVWFVLRLRTDAVPQARSLEVAPAGRPATGRAEP